jgi:hypothetical protein
MGEAKLATQAKQGYWEAIRRRVELDHLGPTFLA